MYAQAKTQVLTVTREFAAAVGTETPTTDAPVVKPACRRSHRHARRTTGRSARWMRCTRR
jgi:hypothetical protein